MASHTLPQHPGTCTTCTALRTDIARLERDDIIDMYSAAGGYRAIDRLPAGVYAVVFADIDYLKKLNTATGSHFRSNRYLAAGLRVRTGELAMRVMGDEFAFVLANGRCIADPQAFIARLARQLAAQPLLDAERAMLPGGRLSATFAWRANVAQPNIRATIEALSADVLAQKARRDGGL